MTKNPIVLCTGALVSLACACAWAQDVPREQVSLGVPVAVDDLSTLRGGTDTTVDEIRVRGTTSNNVADHVQTGTNTITDGAFGQMSGIPLVVQNSGANVLIQNAVILNLQLH